MNQLEKNIVNSMGKSGKRWIQSLPGVVEKLSQHWSLSDITPVNNMSWNYVAFAKDKNDCPVVLKISADPKVLQDEQYALRHFNGQGAVRVVDSNQEYNAILLERAIPGYSLKTLVSNKMSDCIKIYAKVAKKLTSNPSPISAVAHMSKWCSAIDRIKAPQIEAAFVEVAKQVRMFLLESVEKEYLCHGDLHLDNVILKGDEWIAIDPKGIVGEMAFEASAFDLVDKLELLNYEFSPAKIIDRINLLAQALQIKPDRLLQWIFLRGIISAQWFVEDRGDPSDMLTLVRVLYPLVKETLVK